MSEQNQLSNQPKDRTIHEGKDTEMRTPARACLPDDTGGLEPTNPERPERHNFEPLTPVRLSECEQAQRFDKFLENLRRGTASPTDLGGCTGKTNLMQRQLLRFADELAAAGTDYRLRHPVDWAARVLHVPAGEPVPSFILEPLERVFERAWIQTPLDVPDKVLDIGRFNFCIITIALGTPDAAELRQRIADGDFDGPRRRIRLTESDLFWHSVTSGSQWMENEAIDEFGNRVCKEPTKVLRGVQPYWTYDGEYVTDVEPASFS